MTFYLLLFVQHWISIILWFLLLLITVAFFTLGERKAMASIQRRKGPDVVGFWGMLQPLADGAKLLVKELIFPLRSTLTLFFLGPVFVFVLSLTAWAVLPLGDTLFITSISLAMLFTLSTGALNIYSIILAGWSSNSRYSFLGGVRATAQMISYELVLGIVNLFIAFYAGSYNFVDIVFAQTHAWFFFPLFPIFILFLIVMLAETNRTPFDLAEAEAELVAGYNIEYSSIMFAMFFLGEYANMLFLSVLCVLYFFGGWSSVFFYPVFALVFKVLFFCLFFVWVRATLPRYRYDQLMDYGWKHLLPFSFGFFIFIVGLFLIFDLRCDGSDLISNQNLLYYIYILQQPEFYDSLPVYVTSFTIFIETELDLFYNTYYNSDFFFFDETIDMDPFGIITEMVVEAELDSLYENYYHSNVFSEGTPVNVFDLREIAQAVDAFFADLGFELQVETTPVNIEFSDMVNEIITDIERCIELEAQGNRDPYEILAEIENTFTILGDQPAMTSLEFSKMVDEVITDIEKSLIPLNDSIMTQEDKSFLDVLHRIAVIDGYEKEYEAFLKDYSAITNLEFSSMVNAIIDDVEKSLELEAQGNRDPYEILAEIENTFTILGDQPAMTSLEFSKMVDEVITDIEKSL